MGHESDTRLACLLVGLNDQIARTKAAKEEKEEAQKQAMLGVLAAVSNLIKTSPNSFLLKNVPDAGSPHRLLFTKGVLADDSLVDISVCWMGRDEVEVFVNRCVSDGLKYRVTMFAGNKAEQYQTTPGYSYGISKETQCCLAISEAAIVTDNWAETKVDASQALELLRNLKRVVLPAYRPGGFNSLCPDGSPRIKVYGGEPIFNEI